MPPSPGTSLFQRQLRRYRTDRMWNINTNIVLADLLSTAITAMVIEAIQARLATPTRIVLATAIIDGTISLAVFASLHTCVNRDRGMKDLARVQIHRWMLSPLHYLIGISIQYGLLAVDLRASIGVLVAYWMAVALVRIIHTLYGKRSVCFIRLVSRGTCQPTCLQRPGASRSAAASAHPQT